MGEEIRPQAFGPQELEAFAARLADETARLRAWAQAGRLDERARTAGFELEAWLVDRNAFPLPENERYLARLADPLVVSELARFNVEFNGTPRGLHGPALRLLEQELAATWARAVRVAHEFGGTLAAIGILPTVREDDLSLANISPMNRYHALNAQVLAARQGRPIRLDIRGRERLALAHPDVMLEAAATSFQVHLQVPASASVRAFNAATVLAAPLVAVAANSPFLFQASLWEETRIPLFEQAVDTSDFDHPDRCRVTFGEGYVEHALSEVFDDNLARFAPLLPIAIEAPADELRHLRLHNGTIWRWNRPLVGFDAAGTPHLRIEFRPMPAGPSLIDMMANAALFYGAVHVLAAQDVPPESQLPFEAARENFYRCARHGLDAQVRWLDGRVVPVRSLLAEVIVPMARDGLQRLDIDADDIDRTLDVAAARVRTGQTGAAWQRAHVERHGREFGGLLADYLEHQRSGMPVHEWTV